MKPAALGFTLIELIMVMVITGILAAVVGPRFFDRQVFDERMFFEESIGAVRYAQKLALASGCLTEVSLSQAGYQLRSDKNCALGGAIPDFCVGDLPPTACRIVGPDGQDYADALVPVPSGVVLQANNFPLVFDSLGRPVGGAANASIGGFTLNVAAETGSVQ